VLPPSGVGVSASTRHSALEGGASQRQRAVDAVPAEETQIMLSALQHYLFCPRQCALIHVEGVWNENFLTASGRSLHERVDQRGGETRKRIHLATALRLVSKRLGVTGVADMVEFHRQDAPFGQDGQRLAARLPGRNGFWRPFPVEYKRGKPKPHRADAVQLCAQALCLEEMLNLSIASGALFYGATKRRVEVPFDVVLRQLTEKTVANVRNLLCSGKTPLPVWDNGCRACSLIDLCRPREVTRTTSAQSWLNLQLNEAGA